MTHHRIAVLGAGPAGALTAALLARAGRRVVVFDAGARPPLVVGESLLPTIVPILRELGVEEEVAAIGVHKPGATLIGDGCRYTFPFQVAEGDLPAYAYHVPRDAFDRILVGAATRAGATLVEASAGVVRDGDGVRLDAETAPLAERALGGPPDLIVDATGRRHLLERTLGLEHRAGQRRDVALFAHLDHAALPDAGHIHVDRLERGWSWRIPLPGRVSVGVVLGREHLATLGGAEAAYDHLRATEPVLVAACGGARRLTPVMKYSNYQRHTPRIVGPGWALVGDAAGFLDPIFSTGVHLAADGARRLAAAVIDGRAEAMQAYQDTWLDELQRWGRIIDTWYDGSLLSLLRTGSVMAERAMGGRVIEGHVARHMTRVFTGEAGKARYGRRLLDVMLPMGRVGREPLAIR